jgi:hypothetical protein
MSWPFGPKCKKCGVDGNKEYGNNPDGFSGYSYTPLGRCKGCNEYYCDNCLENGRCSHCHDEYERERERKDQEKWAEWRREDAERKEKQQREASELKTKQQREAAAREAAKPDWQKQIDKRLQAEAEQALNNRRCIICGQNGQTQCRICGKWTCGKSTCIYLGICRNCH